MSGVTRSCLPLTQPGPRMQGLVSKRRRLLRMPAMEPTCRGLQVYLHPFPSDGAVLVRPPTPDVLAADAPCRSVAALGQTRPG